MTRNPFYNAGAALLYIVLIISIMQAGSQLAQQTPEDDFWVPVVMLSLFVLSAAMMGYIFLYQPLVLFMDGKREEALTLFWKTAAAFAGIICLIFFIGLRFF